MFNKLIPFIFLGLSASAVSADIFGTGENQFSMLFVEIGNPGNPADASKDPAFGRVAYTYRMGTHEVSRAMIAAYNAESGGPQITIYEGGATWLVPESPANEMTWNEAARFVNWLNTSNGYPRAYKFTSDGAVDDIELWAVGDPGYDPANPTRNQRARYFLPSEDEWYKAAFYDPDANVGKGAYWDFATGSDNAPMPVAGGTASGTAVFGQELSDGPAPITSAGGLSPYGTMGQSGNVGEFLESSFVIADNPPVYRVQRPGNWWSSASGPPDSRPRNGYTPSSRNYFTGFRVASVSPLSRLQLDNLSVAEDAVTANLSSIVGGVDISRSFDLVSYGPIPVAENISPGKGVVIDTFPPSDRAFYKALPHGSPPP